MSKFEVSFGSRTIQCKEFTTTSALNTMPTATLKLLKEEFKSLGTINYLDDVIIERVEPRQRLFAGNVVSITKGDSGKVVINLEGGIEFSDTYMTGLKVMRIAPPEVVYSMARMAGVPDSRLSIEGLDVSDKEMAAFIPFKGMKVKEKTLIGDIELIDLNELKSKITSDKNDDLWRGFLDADGWLFFKFTAKHFAVAEKLAIEKADAFFTLQSSAIQFSHSQFNASIVEWERSKQFVQLKRKNHILLVMLKGGAAWLRDLTAYTPTKDQLSHNIEFSIDKVVKAEAKQQLPLLVWNRFRDSDDYHVVTVGFWQIIELLCTDTKLPKKISKKDLKDFKERVSLSLTADDLEKIKPVIENLNQRTLLEKLEKFLSDNDIELGEDDTQLIEAFRKIRNDIEHGRKPSEPSLQELIRLKAVLNMLLINSYKKL